MSEKFHAVSSFDDLKKGLEISSTTNNTKNYTKELAALEKWYNDRKKEIGTNAMTIAKKELQELKNAIEDTDEELDTSKLSVTETEGEGEIKYEEPSEGQSQANEAEIPGTTPDTTLDQPGTSNSGEGDFINKFIEKLKKLPLFALIFSFLESFKKPNATSIQQTNGEQIVDNTLAEISQTDTPKDDYETLLRQADTIDALTNENDKKAQKEALQKICLEKKGTYYKHENGTESGILIERRKAFTDKIGELKNKKDLPETPTEDKKLLESQIAYTEKQKQDFDNGLNDLNWTTTSGSTARETVKNTQSHEEEAKKLLNIPLTTWEHTVTLGQAHEASGEKVTKLIGRYEASEDPIRKAQLYKELGTNLETLEKELAAYKTAKESYAGDLASGDFATKLSEAYDKINSRHNNVLTEARKMQKDYKENYGPVNPYSKGIYVYNKANGKIYERLPGNEQFIKLYKDTDNTLHLKFKSNYISLNASVQDGNYFAVPKDFVDTLMTKNSSDVQQTDWNLTIEEKALSGKLRKLELNGYNLEKTPETTETTVATTENNETTPTT